MKALIVKPPAKKKGLPYPFYRLVLLVMALLGLADSIYLAVSHYKVHTDMLHKSFCAISKSINCDTVSQSIYSIFLGVPFAVWGIIAYVFILVLLVFMKNGKAKSMRVWTFAFWACVVFVAYSAVLFYVSKFLVQSYCIMCIGTYIINCFMLYWCWLVLRRFSEIGLINETWQIFRYLAFFKKPMFPVLVVFGCVAVITMIFYPPYWKVDVPPVSAEVSTGITENGYPWIGAEDPVLVIEEFTDYQCFQCRKMHYFMRQLVNMYPKKLRLVHVNFPMDHAINPLVEEPFHVGSAILAAISEKAVEEGDFWAVNDKLFGLVASSGSGFTTADVAEAIGWPVEKIEAAIKDEAIVYRVYVDILRGISRNIAGTPSYLIEGNTYEANIPAEFIRRLEQD